MANVEKIYCDECGTAVAERRGDGRLSIRSWHRGLIHVTIIPPALKAPTSERNKPEKIQCGAADCMKIIAELRADGTIIIRARHHGETHVTIIESMRVKGMLG